MSDNFTPENQQAERETARYAIAQNDLVSAMRLTLRRQLTRPFPIGIAITICVLLAIVLQLGGMDHFPVLITACVLALPVIIFLTFVVFIPWQARRQYTQAALLREETTLEWSKEKVKLSGQHGHADLPWTIFHAWNENSQLFVIHQSDALINIVPKAALSAAQITDLRDCLQKAGVRRL